jgi:hypothetical protein
MKLVLFYAIGLLTALVVMAVSAALDGILDGQLMLSESSQSLFIGGSLIVPFLLLSGMASMRVAAITAGMTALAWALMWSTIFLPDPSIVGANIGLGLAIMFSPIPITIAAALLELALKRLKARKRSH